MSYNPGMLVYFYIHPDLGCPLVPKSLEIPRQMGYLTQSFEATVVPHESTNLPIEMRAGSYKLGQILIKHWPPKPCQYPK